MHYNRHRHYDPSVGQFTTQDPIGLLGGVNGYQYAPNPVHWIDLFGLTCEEDVAKKGYPRIIHLRTRLISQLNINQKEMLEMLRGQKLVKNLFRSNQIN